MTGSSLTAPGIPPIPPSEKKNMGLIVGVTVSVGVVSIMVICVVLFIKRKASDLNEDEGTAAALFSLVLAGHKVAHSLFYHVKETTFYKMKWVPSNIGLIFQ